MSILAKELLDTQNTALVLGAGGFIGHHLVQKLIQDGYWVRAVDLNKPMFSDSSANEFILGDLGDLDVVSNVVTLPDNLGTASSSSSQSNFRGFDEIYQLAADMGGAGYVFSGENDAAIAGSSVRINLNVADALANLTHRSGENHTRLFFSSSACVYPERNLMDPDNPNCREETAYPAEPNSEYGWAKLFSERLFLAYRRNYNVNFCVARYHNIYGPEGLWNGGKEKALMAICRKIALSEETDEIEIWGDGNQTRSFLYIDDCIDATIRLMRSDIVGPINIGSEEAVTINDLVQIIAEIAEKRITTKHIDGPLGVRGRNSDNSILREKLAWESSTTLKAGLTNTYEWIRKQTGR